MQAMGPSLPANRPRNGSIWGIRRYAGIHSANYMNDLWVFDTHTLLWRFVPVGGDEQPKRSNFSMCYDEVHER